MIDIIQEINAMCTAQGWRCAFGLDAFEKNIATSEEYTAGEKVLAFDAKYTPVVLNTVVVSGSWRVTASLGRKFDPFYVPEGFDGTTASLDETHQQKYDRRLYALMLDLISNFGALACAHDLDARFGEIGFDVNLYDTNIDFVTCEIILNQE